jgi:hypothetical protein
MSRNIPSLQRIASLKLEAKHAARARGVGHSQVLDELAVREGFANWSLLAKASSACSGQHSSQPSSFRYTRTLEEQRRAFFLADREMVMERSSHVNRVHVDDLTSEFDCGLTALRFARDYMRNVVRLPRFQVRTRTAGYWEMRQWLPYGLGSVENTDTVIAFNRYYKPVGSIDLGKFFDYSALPHMAVRIERDIIERVSGGSVGYFYNDGCPPWRNRAMAQQYLSALEQVVEHVGG